MLESEVGDKKSKLNRNGYWIIHILHLMDRFKKKKKKIAKDPYLSNFSFFKKKNLENTKNSPTPHTISNNVSLLSTIITKNVFLKVKITPYIHFNFE